MLKPLTKHPFHWEKKLLMKIILNKTTSQKRRRKAMKVKNRTK